MSFTTHSAVVESAVSLVFLGTLMLWVGARLNRSRACAWLGISLLAAAVASTVFDAAPDLLVARLAAFMGAAFLATRLTAALLSAVCALLCRNPRTRAWIHPHDDLRIPGLLAVAAAAPAMAATLVLMPAACWSGAWAGTALAIGLVGCARAGAACVPVREADAPGLGLHRAAEAVLETDGPATPFERLAAPLAQCSAWFACLSFARGVDVVAPLCVVLVDTLIVAAGAWLLERARVVGEALAA